MQSVDLAICPSDNSHNQDRPSVAANAQRRLHASPYASLRRVTCHYHKGVLTLRGCVPTFHMKQVTQTIVALVEGVEQVVNRVEVFDIDPALRDSEVT